jgi:uncharacterized membrane protein
MDIGIIVDISCRLILGAVGAFLAIMLWSKTHNIAWLLIVLGTILNYVNIAYSVLSIFGVEFLPTPYIGSKDLIGLILGWFPQVFYIAALLVMVWRKYRRFTGPSSGTLV